MSGETVCGPQKVHSIHLCNRRYEYWSNVCIVPSHYQVVANGCGTVGFQLQQMETMDFTECCNWHDACYATCGLKKSTCEKKFDQCLKKMCTSLSDATLQGQCQQNKSLYVMGVQMMGCQAYQDSQAEACTCVKSKADVSEAYKARIQQLYETHGEEEALSLETTQATLLEKYTGKESTMLFRLLKKFPRAVKVELPAEDARPAVEHDEHDRIDEHAQEDVDHIEL